MVARVLVALLVAAAPVAPALAQSSPAPAAPAATASQDAALAAFFDEYDRAELALSPLAKTWRGIRDADYGKWDDWSEAGQQARYQLTQNAAAEMRRRFDPARLSGQSLLSYRLFDGQARREAEAWRFRHYRFAFDQMNGAQSRLPAMLINLHRVDTLADAQAYVSRLEGMGAALDQAIANARASEAAGVMPPRWVFPYVIADSRNVTTGAPFGAGPDSALWADFKAKLARVSAPQAQKDQLLARAEAALKDVVAPAYGRVIAWAEGAQARAPAGDGAWRFPDGADYYGERLRWYTTTGMSAEEVHALGLREVARIHGEMDAIRRQVGFAGDLKAFFKYMRERPENYLPNTPEGREEYLRRSRAAIEAMQAKLPQYFSPAAVPRDPIIVQAVEPFRERSAGKSFYQDPAPNGSRPGVFYANLYNMADMPVTEIEALAFHEGVPGHHLDGSVTTKLEGLPAFRRFGGYTAWSEGWGLYAEKLGKDMGFYTDPYSDFGRLQLELHRAVRLVVDTGLHHKRWSREQAIQYVLDNTADAPGGVVKAIERYAVFPGQATAYMVGRLKITDLRDRAQRELGPRFTMAGFHDAVLLSGAVPLDVMEENVLAWIAREKAGASRAAGR
ncbi:MAG: DUF885 domain-containing protein [Sphingomonadaceae bacterium]